MRASASMMWVDKVLEFYAFGWGPRVMHCHREGHDLVWEYVNGSVTRMKKICILLKEKKSCAKRPPISSILKGMSNITYFFCRAMVRVCLGVSSPPPRRFSGKCIFCGEFGVRFLLKNQFCHWRNFGDSEKWCM